MLDSFLMGALPALIFGIFYYGWKFLRLKEPTKKQLMTRIVISSIFLAFNLIMIIGNLFTLNSIKEDGIGFMIITVLIFLAFSIGLGLLLVKDIEKYSLHKNKSSQSQSDNKINSNSNGDILKNENLEDGKLSEEEQYPSDKTMRLVVFLIFTVFLIFAVFIIFW